MPLSPETSGEGRCDEPVELPGGETVLALRWTDGGEVLRRMKLRLNAAGEPGSFSHSDALDRPADRIAGLRERCGESSTFLEGALRPPT